MEALALEFQFQQAVNLDPAAAMSGQQTPQPQQPQGVNGAGLQDTADLATVSADPRLLAQAGTQGVSAAPSPDAGYNTTAPRNVAEAAGLEPNV